MGQYEVIIPQATENLVSNSSFEETISPWITANANTIERTREASVFGSYSAKCSIEPSGTTTMASFALTVPKPGQYVFSCWMWMPDTWDGGEVFVNNANYTSSTQDDITNRNYDQSALGTWQRVWIVWTADKADLAGQVQISRSASPSPSAGQFVYIDAVQAEFQAEPTSYCDGDQEGCEWLGLPHTSTSKRSQQIRAGGLVKNFEDDYQLFIEQLHGIGLPAMRNITRDRGHIPGLEFQRTIPDARVMRFTRSHLIQTSLPTLHTGRRSLIDAVKPDDQFGKQPVIIQYTGAAEDKRIKVRYDTGLEFQNQRGFSEVLALQFLAFDPFWEATVERSVPLATGAESPARSIIGRIGNKWSFMDITRISGGNQDVLALTVGLDGKVYVGGDFTNWNGVTGRNYIAVFDSTKQIYSDLVLYMERDDLVAYWPLWDNNETGWSNAINLEGDSNKDGTFNGVAWDQDTFANTENTVGEWVASENDVCDVYSSTLNSEFPGFKGSLLVWAKVAGAGEWTDGTQRVIARLMVDAQNFIEVRKSSTNNQLDVVYEAGNVNHTFNVSSISPTGWFQIGLTWDREADEVKLYINGSQSGSTQTGMGTWTGNLSSTLCCIGAQSTSGTGGFNGHVAHVALWGKALTATQMRELSITENPWSTVGSASAVNGKVTGLATGPDGTIYLAGHFTNVGDANGDYVVAWDGTNWSSLGTPASGITFTAMNAVAVGPDNKVWVGGNFGNLAGVAAADHVAYWDGSAWNGMTGSPPMVSPGPLEIDIANENIVYFAGLFDDSGNGNTYVAKYDVDSPNGLEPLRDGIDTGSGATSVAVDQENGDVYFTGNFTSIDGDTAAKGITRWDGIRFNALSTGAVGQMWATAVDSNGLIWAVGEHSSVGGNLKANEVAAWDGSIWRHQDKVVEITSIIPKAIATDSRGQIFIGWDNWQLDIQHGEPTLVTVAGSAIVYPRIVVKRTGGSSATLLSLFNETTGATLQFDLLINDGEQITLDLAPGNRSIISSWLGIDRFNVLPSSQLGNWYLIPGDNVINLFVEQSGAPVIDAFIVFREQYLSSD